MAEFNLKLGIKVMEGFMAWSHSAHFVSLDRPNHGQDSKGGLGQNMYFTLDMGGGCTKFVIPL